MRELFPRLLAFSLAAGALALSACGKSETVNVADTNMIDVNAAMPMEEGTINDVTAIDATVGSDANVVMDNAASTPTDNATESNTAG